MIRIPNLNRAAKKPLRAAGGHSFLPSRSARGGNFHGRLMGRSTRFQNEVVLVLVAHWYRTTEVRRKSPVQQHEKIYRDTKDLDGNGWGRRSKVDLGISKVSRVGSRGLGLLYLL